MLVKIFRNKITDANGLYGDKQISTYRYVESLIKRYVSLLATKQELKTGDPNDATNIQSSTTSYMDKDGTYSMHTYTFYSLEPSEDLTQWEFVHGIDGPDS